jgi:hypothetical protein
MPQPNLEGQRTGGFVERPPVAIAQPGTGTNGLAIMPTDILPEQAKTDPEFREGHGSMFASNQPNLAAKYGVIRGNQVIPPQKLISGQRQLSPATVRDLEQLQKLQESQAPNTHQDDREAEASVSDASRAAATVGDLPTAKGALSEAEKKEIGDTIRSMDEFEFDAWRQTMMKDLLNSPEQKDIIEKRLKEMDLGDLITQGYITQKVPIVVGKFEPTFKTSDGETDLALKRLIMEDANSLEVSDRYYLDKFSLMSVAASVHAINGKQFPDHRDAEGNFNDDLFRKKFTMVLRLPMHMLASLGVNAFWFDIRVRKLFVAEKLGNG